MNKTKDNFFARRAVTLEINVTKELQVPHIFGKCEKEIRRMHEGNIHFLSSQFKDHVFAL